MSRTTSGMPASADVVGVDDDVDAVAEDAQLAVGDQRGDLDERVAPQVEAGHLAVDPHQTVVHPASLFATLRRRGRRHERRDRPAAGTAHRRRVRDRGRGAGAGHGRRRRSGRSDGAGPHPAGDAQPARPRRRRDRHRQDQDAAGARRAAVGRRRAGAAGRRQGRPVRDGPAGRGQRARSSRAATDTGDDWTPTAYPVEFLSLGGKSSATPIRATLTQFGPILLTQGARPQRHAGVDARADLPLGRPAQPAAARHQGPARRHPAPHLRRGQGRPQGHRRRLVGDGRGHPARAGEPRGRGRRRLLRRARVRPRGPAAHGRRQGRRHAARAGRPGRQPAPVLHLPHVAARRAVRGPARGGRPRQAQARVLLRRGAPAVHRRVARRSGSASSRPSSSSGPRASACSSARSCPPTSRTPCFSQLGARVQHALRAFTPEDQAALAKTVKTYPNTKDYDIEEALTSLGIGEAIVTVLSERGAPTPVAWTRMRAPRSLMAALGRRRRDRGRAGVAAARQVRHDGRPRVGLRAADGADRRAGPQAPPTPRRRAALRPAARAGAARSRGSSRRCSARRWSSRSCGRWAPSSAARSPAGCSAPGPPLARAGGVTAAVSRTGVERRGRRTGTSG